MMLWNLLKSQILSYFEHHFRRRLEAEDSELPDNEHIEQVLSDICLEYTPKNVICKQNYYLSHVRDLYMGHNTSTQ
jgi:hypothetical protein